MLPSDEKSTNCWRSIARMKRILLAATILLLSSTALAQPAAPPAPPAKPAKTKLTWYGHAAFRIDTPSGKVLLVDPWLTNPANPNGKDDLAKLTAADLILVTHGHSDHVGDAVAIAKKTKAKLVGTFDLGGALVVELGFPKDRIGMDTMGNFGGDVSFFDGEVTVRFVPAVHGSTVGKDDTSIRAAGNPGGFVISVKGGPVLYHTGDTDVFGDMAFIGKEFKVTHMLGCIGGHFTMGPNGAAEAAKLVKPRNFIPMHFGTFPVLTGTVDQLKAALKKKGAGAVKVMPLEIGKTVEL
jgi:L-ascorbate metabolism protein UlaG (beta-lactamase superfamily)